MRPANGRPHAAAGCRSILAAALAVASAVVFAALLIAVRAGALDRARVDMRVVTAAHNAVLAHPALLSAARGLTNLGAPVVVDVLAAVAAAALWFTGRRYAAVYVLAVRISAQIVDSAVKVLLHRARPVLLHPVAHAAGHSFPSGHATGAASLYLPLAVVAGALFTRNAPRRLALAVAALICLTVAATRVLLAVHYPSDVLAGLALGSAASAAFMPVLRARSADGTLGGVQADARGGRATESPPSRK